MDFKKILENKTFIAAIIGGIVLLLVVFIVCGTIASTSKADKEQIDVSNEPLKEDVDFEDVKDMCGTRWLVRLKGENNL